MALHPTLNDMPKKKRARLCDLLNARLADAVDLASQVKQAHWNVKGPAFIALHELFDDIHGTVESQVDDLAERITALGGTAIGGVAPVAAATTLAPYPSAITSGREHLAALAAVLSHYAKSVRQAIETSAELGDAGTADLFTGVSRAADKALWLVEAHLQAES